MTRLERLVALRELLDERLAAAKPRESAALAKELRAVLAEIERLEALVPRESMVDELANARNARRAVDPKGGASAGGDSKTGTS